METDCRTEEGITVGLIDSIIFICRILVKRNHNSDIVRDAFLDLLSDEDVLSILDKKLKKEEQVVGYIVEDSEGRYLSYSICDGFMYRRIYQNPPHIFDNEIQAKQHAVIFNASGVVVKPIYTELKGG